MCTNNPEIQTSTGPRTIDNLGQTLNVLSVPSMGAVAYRPGVKQVQGLYQFNGRAGGGRQGMREVGASARLS